MLKGPISTIGVESDYARILNNLFKQIDVLFRQKLKSQTGITLRTDSLADDIASFITNWIIWIQRLEFPQLRYIFSRINVLSQQQVRSVLAVNPVVHDINLQEVSHLFITQNISLIKKLLEDHYKSVEQICYKNILDGEGFSELAQQLEPYVEATEKHAVIIARDQTTKYYAKLNEYRYENFGFHSYIWHTSQDERVRISHAKLDNTSHKFSEPPVTVTEGKRAGERNNPGGDILCRCWAEPI